MANKLGFSQRHPLLFGMLILMAAVVLIFGAMAAFTFFVIEHGGKKKVASEESFGVVNITGVIFESREYTKWIKRLEEDDDIIGVILRIDSPGGGVSASQDIHRAVKRLTAKKPVVVSMATVAASGGYYVACPATSILANPGTITGSIGVRMELSNIMGLMDMLGITHESFTSGKLKDSGSPYRELTKEERAYFQSLVADLFDQFVTDVAEGRKLPIERIKAIADGRVLTGRQAMVEGLIDGLGGMEDARNLLKKLCKVPDDDDPPLVEGPKMKEEFLGGVFDSLSHIQTNMRLKENLPQFRAPF